LKFVSLDGVAPVGVDGRWRISGKRFVTCIFNLCPAIPNPSLDVSMGEVVTIGFCLTRDLTSYKI
jgi:hypothetical protein